MPADVKEAGKFESPLPSPLKVVASTLPNEPVDFAEPLMFPVYNVKLPLYGVLDGLKATVAVRASALP